MVLILLDSNRSGIKPGRFTPVVAAVAGWLVLEQSLTRWQLLGVTLALGSLIVSQRTSTQYARTPRTTTSPIPTPTDRCTTDLERRNSPALDT